MHLPGSKHSIGCLEVTLIFYMATKYLFWQQRVVFISCFNASYKQCNCYSLDVLFFKFVTDNNMILANIMPICSGAPQMLVSYITHTSLRIHACHLTVWNADLWHDHSRFHISDLYAGIYMTFSMTCIKARCDFYLLHSNIVFTFFQEADTELNWTGELDVNRFWQLVKMCRPQKFAHSDGTINFSVFAALDQEHTVDKDLF